MILTTLKKESINQSILNNCVTALAELNKVVDDLVEVAWTGTISEGNGRVSDLSVKLCKNPDGTSV